jgi:pimeloyl-ACP methyl ester carboxylesterase
MDLQYPGQATSDREMGSVEAWAKAGSYVRWNGHRVFFRMQGRGEALLLLHGIPTASWIWHRLWPLLLPRHRLIAPDLLGFGLSDKPPALVADVFAQADLAQALLSHFGVERYRVLAADYGATVAQELLARGDPGLVSLCILNGGIFPEAHRPSLAQRLVGTRLCRPLARLIWRRAFARSIARLAGPRTRPDRMTVDALWRLLIGGGGRAALPAMMGYMAVRREHRDRWVGALERARIPCRHVCGTADPVCGAEMRRLWRTRVPGGDLVELPGVGHWPALEAPRAVAEAVLAFHRVRRMPYGTGPLS